MEQVNGHHVPVCPFSGVSAQTNGNGHLNNDEDKLVKKLRVNLHQPLKLMNYLDKAQINDTLHTRTQDFTVVVSCFFFFFSIVLRSQLPMNFRLYSIQNHLSFLLHYV